jgi:hypothetical protein
LARTLACVGIRQPDDALQVADTDVALPLAEHVENVQPRRVRQCFEQLRTRARLVVRKARLRRPRLSASVLRWSPLRGP